MGEKMYAKYLCFSFRHGFEIWYYDYPLCFDDSILFRIRISKFKPKYTVL